MQINRLFETVHMLLNKKSMTARELAEHFEVSIRTVYRDIETLTFAGIPVYSTRGKNGGIKLLDEYVLDKSIISKDEQNDILYALQSLKAANYPEVEETLEKLSVIFNKTSGNWIEVDFSEYGNEQKELFENIKNAIINKKVIRFEYYNSQGIKSERSAEPLKLKFKVRAWYLSAFCRKSNEMRFFKINSLDSLVKSKFGIMEPDLNSEEIIADNAHVLVPLIGLNKYQQRLGFGGGFYDKYFGLHRNNILYGLAYDFQIDIDFVAEEHDILMDHIIVAEVRA